MVSKIDSFDLKISGIDTADAARDLNERMKDIKALRKKMYAPELVDICEIKHLTNGNMLKSLPEISMIRSEALLSDGKKTLVQIAGEQHGNNIYAEDIVGNYVAEKKEKKSQEYNRTGSGNIYPSVHDKLNGKGPKTEQLNMNELGYRVRDTVVNINNKRNEARESYLSGHRNDGPVYESYSKTGREKITGISIYTINEDCYKSVRNMRDAGMPGSIVSKEYAPVTDDKKMLLEEIELPLNTLKGDAITETLKGEAVKEVMMYSNKAAFQQHYNFKNNNVKESKLFVNQNTVQFLYTFRYLTDDARVLIRYEKSKGFILRASDSLVFEMLHNHKLHLNDNGLRVDIENEKLFEDNSDKKHRQKDDLSEDEE